MSIERISNFLARIPGLGGFVFRMAKHDPQLQQRIHIEISGTLPVEEVFRIESEKWGIDAATAFRDGFKGKKF